MLYRLDNLSTLEGDAIYREFFTIPKATSSLDLSSVVHSADSYYLARGLNSLDGTKVQEVNLSYNLLGQRTRAGLVQIFEGLPPQVKTLSLRYNSFHRIKGRIGEEYGFSLADLQAVFLALRHVTTVDVTGNGFDTFGTKEEIAALFKSFPSIHFIFGDSPFEQGVKALLTPAVQPSASVVSDYAGSTFFQPPARGKTCAADALFDKLPDGTPSLLVC